MLFSNHKENNYSTDNNSSEYIAKFISGVLVGLFLVLALTQVIFEVSNPIKLLAACSSWTSGNDTGSCSGTTTSGQDFGEGDDSMTNSGLIDINSNDWIVHSDFVSGNDYAAIIWINGGNSNDTTTESIANSGTIRGGGRIADFSDSGSSGTNNVNLIMFENHNGSKTLTNSSSGVVRNQGDGYTIYGLNGVGGSGSAVMTIDNDGIIDNTNTNGEIIYTSRLYLTNSGTIGRNLISSSTGISVTGSASSTVNNESSGTIYSGFDFSNDSSANTFINRGTLSVNSILLGGANDTFLTNLTSGSVLGTINGGSGTDIFKAEVTSGNSENFAKFGTNFETYYFTGGGSINLITTFSYSEDIIVDEDTTLSADDSVTFAGDFDLNETVDGNLSVSINSDTPTTTSRFDVSGTSYLAGVLTVTDSGSSLSEGDSFVLLESGTISGTFTTINLPSLGSGLAWETSYANDKVTVTVISTGSTVTTTTNTNVSSGRSGSGFRSRTSRQDEEETQDKSDEIVEVQTNNQNKIYDFDGSSCPTFRDYLRRGEQNNYFEVSKWQVFLNSYINSNIPYTGEFDLNTESATKDFQLKHSDQILEPWGLSEPTGFVYKTTRSFANFLTNCPEGAIELDGIRTFSHQ